jgi:thymidine kinase
MPKQPGRLEVICGTMFSGKSEELIRRLRRAQIANLKVKTFKHAFDRRKDTHNVVSHDGNSFEAQAHATIESIAALVHDPTLDVIGIDEAQFFSNKLISTVCTLINQGKRIVIAGLDLDFRGKPFGCMSTLMAIADSVTKLQAICTQCGQDAHFTQRLVNGKPAKHDDPIIVIGAQEKYQARCRTCYAIDIPFMSIELL